MESQGPLVEHTFPQIPQIFKTLKPNSPLFPAKLKASSVDNSPLQPSNSLDKPSMADRHQHLVSDVIVIEVNDYGSSNNNKPRKSKNHVSVTRNSVIELIDDDYGNNVVVDDDDCIFVKRERNLMPKGKHKKDPICIEECKKEREFHETAKMGKKSSIDIDCSVQCVDDYDVDNDEIRIITVKPSSRSSSSSYRKKRKPFSGPSITEVGESSGSNLVENDDMVVEIEPIEIMFLCEICADSKPQKESFRINGCSHSYCSECMKNYVASKLQDGVSQINCPVPSCSGILEPEYCRDILPFDVFVRWGNLLCESVILASQKFYCPFKDCSALLVDDGSEKVTRSECPSCFRLFCAQCKVGWHEGIGCGEYQALSKDEREKDDIMLRKLAKSKNWQRCPKCMFYVEKSAGCHYMKCRCGVAFCYSCGSIHTDHRYHFCQKCRH